MESRDTLIEGARNIEPDFGLDIEGPGKFEASPDRELTAALNIFAGHGHFEIECGDTNGGSVYTQVGRFVLVTDEQGFLSHHAFQNAADAEHALLSEFCEGYDDE